MEQWIYARLYESAMEIMDNAQGGRGIRHPKFKGFRVDKDPRDCTIDQLK